MNNWIEEREVTHAKDPIDSVEARVVAVEGASEPCHGKIVSELHDVAPDVAWFRVQG